MSMVSVRRPVSLLAMALGVLAMPHVLSASERGAFLTIGYEATDVSHVACLVEYPGRAPRWIGFGPAVKYKLASSGALDASSLEKQLVRYARFRVDPRRLEQAERRVTEDYRGKNYILGVRDCVTFVIDLASYAGLDVPFKGHWRVASVIDDVSGRNAGRLESLDDLPYPWSAGRAPAPRAEKQEFVRVRLEYVACREAESLGYRDRLYLLAFDPSGRRRKISIGKLGDGDRWQRGAALFVVPRGSTIAVQLWDADHFNDDDLVFQASLRTEKDGRFYQVQTRGRAITGSKSVYRLGLSVEPAD